MIQSMHHIHEFTHHPIQTLIQDIFHDSFQDQSIIPSNIQSVTPSKMQPMIQSKIQPIVQSKIQSMIQVSCFGFSDHDLTMTQKVTFDLNPDLTLISRPTFPNGSVP